MVTVQYFNHCRKEHEEVLAQNEQLMTEYDDLLKSFKNTIDGNKVCVSTWIDLKMSQELKPRTIVEFFMS